MGSLRVWLRDFNALWALLCVDVSGGVWWSSTPSRKAVLWSGVWFPPTLRRTACAPCGVSGANSGPTFSVRYLQLRSSSKEMYETTTRSTTKRGRAAKGQGSWSPRLRLGIWVGRHLKLACAHRQEAKAYYCANASCCRTLTSSRTERSCIT